MDPRGNVVFELNVHRTEPAIRARDDHRRMELRQPSPVRHLVIVDECQEITLGHASGPVSGVRDASPRLDVRAHRQSVGERGHPIARLGTGQREDAEAIKTLGAAARSLRASL